jgi:phosphoserine aminotransferase
VLILGPRAVERLESTPVSWPMPKLFRLTKGGKLDEALFTGATINTPSMLCVEDYLDALRWTEEIGGVEALHHRADANLAAVVAWVERTPWIELLAAEPATRSNTSVCLRLADTAAAERSGEERAALPKRLAALLAKEGAAYDLGAYRDAPPGLRIWCGATVETADVEALLPWLDWAWGQLALGG